MSNMSKRQLYLLFLSTNILFSEINDTALFHQKLSSYIPKTVGLQEFPTINHLKYLGDCSGFVAFLFHLAGLNLKKLYGIADNGVTAIWEGLHIQGFILDNQDLQIGDIIFFDNTYDMNKNMVWDDALSHIAVVESVDEFQTITYVHYGSKGVTRAKMNLKHPHIFITNIQENSYRFNDVLRNSDQRGINPDYLSGSLYRGAARVSVKKKIKS
ncbi:MAG: CHAP domain-containing protein [Brevinema sp.]